MHTITRISPLFLCMLGAVMLCSASYPAHAQSITALTPVPKSQTTIFAGGDIAKCDNDDPWWEEFFELVKNFPESPGEESTEKEPALHELLELVGWIEGTDHYTNARCILAYWHHPVFSSGQQGGVPRMKNILKTLYAGGMSIVLTGYDHDYERFAPQNPDGALDPARGFRTFVVGTGGAPLRPL